MSYSIILFSNLIFHFLGNIWTPNVIFQMVELSFFQFPNH